jgi:hypothetical protein
MEEAAMMMDVRKAIAVMKSAIAIAAEMRNARAVPAAATAMPTATADMSTAEVTATEVTATAAVAATATVAAAHLNQVSSR